MRKLYIFTCENNMLSSHVKISPLLWLHNKLRLSHQKTIKVRASDISRKKSKISRDFQGQIRGKIGRFRGIFAGKKSKFAQKSADFAGEKSKFAQKSADFAGF